MLRLVLQGGRGKLLDLRLHLRGVGPADRGLCVGHGLAALFEPALCLPDLQLAGEDLALGGGDVALKRFQLGHRLPVGRLAVVAVLHRDVSRAGQSVETVQVIPRIEQDRFQPRFLRLEGGE